jgi:hypothetical protein
MFPRSFFFATLLGLAALAGLAADEMARVDARGKITKLDPAADAEKKEGILGTILVEGQGGDGVTYDKAILRVAKQTKIEIVEGKERKPAKYEDLKVGIEVEAVYDGVVMRTIPPQGQAKSITILKNSK